MDATLLSGALGAEIRGIDLKNSSEKNFEVINSLLLEHKVIFFRNQEITPEEQLALAKRFGPLEKHAGSTFNAKTTSSFFGRFKPF